MTKGDWRFAAGSFALGVVLYFVSGAVHRRTFAGHLYPQLDVTIASLQAGLSAAAESRGVYPREAASLLEEHTDPWGGELKYESDGKSWTLSSAGEDGRFGLGEDIVYRSENLPGDGVRAEKIQGPEAPVTWGDRMRKWFPSFTLFACTGPFLLFASAFVPRRWEGGKKSVRRLGQGLVALAFLAVGILTVLPMPG